jgi:hypothetical protein
MNLLPVQTHNIISEKSPSNRDCKDTFGTIVSVFTIGKHTNSQKTSFAHNFGAF